VDQWVNIKTQKLWFWIRTLTSAEPLVTTDNGGSRRAKATLAWLALQNWGPSSLWHPYQLWAAVEKGHTLARWWTDSTGEDLMDFEPQTTLTSLRGPQLVCDRAWCQEHLACSGTYLVTGRIGMRPKRVSSYAQQIKTEHPTNSNPEFSSCTKNNNDNNRTHNSEFLRTLNHKFVMRNLPLLQLIGFA